MAVRFDLHTHHERCGHAIGTIEDYIKQAIQYDLDYIAYQITHLTFIVKMIICTQELR